MRANFWDEKGWDWEEDELLHCVRELVFDQLNEESDYDWTESLLAQSRQFTRLASSNEVLI